MVKWLCVLQTANRPAVGAGSKHNRNQQYANKSQQQPSDHTQHNTHTQIDKPDKRPRHWQGAGRTNDRKQAKNQEAKKKKEPGAGTHVSAAAPTDCTQPLHTTPRVAEVGTVPNRQQSRRTAPGMAAVRAAELDRGGGGEDCRFRLRWAAAAGAASRYVRWWCGKGRAGGAALGSGLLPPLFLPKSLPNIPGHV